MVNPSTESILNQMTNLAMDIALDYVLPASPMSDVCKGDLYEFEREVVAAVNGGVVAGDLMSSMVGTLPGCCGRPSADAYSKKNNYMGAAGCDSCAACLARAAALFDLRSTGNLSGYNTPLSATSTSSSPSPPSSSSSSSSSSSVTTSPTSLTASSPPSGSASALGAMVTLQSTPTPDASGLDISMCQFDGCNFDSADNTYLDICDWLFYSDRFNMTEKNREKVEKAFQMVPPGEVTGYVAEPPPPPPAQPTTGKSLGFTGDIPLTTVAVPGGLTIKTEPGVLAIKPEPEDDYLWTSDNHRQPIILKVEEDANILQITELDHSYLPTGTSLSSGNSSTAVSPIKNHHHHHTNHLVDMLGLVTPPPSRSQSSEEEEIDVVNDSWDTPDPPRKGATMADIMKRGIGKKRDAPVTKWKNTVKRKHKNAASSGYTMPPPPPKKQCGGLSLLDRYKKDNNWKDTSDLPAVPPAIPIIKDEPLDGYPDCGDDVKYDNQVVIKQEIKDEPLDDDDAADDAMDEDDDYDMDADFDALMKNEPEDMLFDDDYDDYDDEHDIDWDKVLRVNSSTDAKNGSSTTRGRRGRKSGGGESSSCSTSSFSSSAGRKKKKKKKSSSSRSSSSSKLSKQHHGHHHQQSGKKIKYEPGCGGGYSYKTKLMDPVKRALHNDLEKSRRVETSMLFMNLSMQVSFLDDNRKIPSKLSILRGAKRECDLMMLDERRLLSEKHIMQQKQRMLRERLFELRREQYHRRYGKNNTAAAAKQ